MIRALAIALLLTACTPAQQVVRAPTPAVAVACPATCTASCLPADWPQWTCSDAEAPECWDELPPVAADLRGIAERCDVARAACLSCLKRPESAGVICGVTRSCE